MSDQSDPSQPDTTNAPPAVDDDGGAALERSSGSIREAREAEGSVAAHDDITSLDEQREGEHSEDPDGEGGAP